MRHIDIVSMNSKSKAKFFARPIIKSGYIYTLIFPAWFTAGDLKYPENTPTSYMLEAKNMETNRWQKILSESHAYHADDDDAKHAFRTHLINKPCNFLREFRLTIHETGETFRNLTLLHNWVLIERMGSIWAFE